MRAVVQDLSNKTVHISTAPGSEKLLVQIRQTAGAVVAGYQTATLAMHQALELADAIELAVAEMRRAQKGVAA
jgi:hypothetical protein